MFLISKYVYARKHTYGSNNDTEIEDISYYDEYIIKSPLEFADNFTQGPSKHRDELKSKEDATNSKNCWLPVF